jgi:hypothetical protein
MANKKPKALNSKAGKKPPRPAFAARAKQSRDSDYWITIGHAWIYEHEYGEPGYEVRLHTIPTSWDGNFLLMPIPKEDDA